MLEQLSRYWRMLGIMRNPLEAKRYSRLHLSLRTSDMPSQHLLYHPFGMLSLDGGSIVL